MARKLKDLPIKYKVLILVSPLVIGILLFSFSRMFESIRFTQEMNSVQQLSRFAVTSSALIHELQKERGMSAGLLGSGGKTYRLEIQEQRKLSDQRLHDFRLLLKETDTDDIDETYRARFSQALTHLEELGKIREKVDRLGIPVDQELFFYSNIIRLFIRNISHSSRLSGNSEISVLLGAYVNVIKGKEKAGIERAVLNNTFGRGQFGAEMYGTFLELTNAQEIYFQNFRENASLEQLAVFRDNKSSEAFRQVRSIRLQARASQFTAKPATWWKYSTERINLIKKLEDKIAGDLSSRSDALRTRSLQFFYFYIILASVLSIATVMLSLVMRNNILTPILRLSNAMKDYEVGRGALEMPEREDEIGTLYSGYAQMNKKLTENLENLEEIVNQRTNQLQVLNQKLSKYLSEPLYKKIFDDNADVQLDHKRRKLTVFFSDIIKFTVATEKMDPEEFSYLLNSYLNAMSRIAHKWGGTIDKFIGDAIMIFFGDPEFTNDRDHALRCVKMSLEMIDALGELRGEWYGRGFTTRFNIRIGINTGFCTVGNFGSEARMDYTVVGGQVNLANRLEGAAGKNKILISHTTYSLIKDEVHCSPMGELQFKGIEHPVRCYQVEGLKTPQEIIKNFKSEEEGFTIGLDLQKINPEKKYLIRKSLRKAYKLVASEEELERVRARKADRRDKI